MNRYLTTAAYLVVVLALHKVHAWIPSPNQQKKIVVTRWADASDKALEMDGNPCWEDLYDDDCVMTNAAAASFVAAKWIKSMPCGEGIKVRRAMVSFYSRRDILLFR